MALSPNNSTATARSSDVIDHPSHRQARHWPRASLRHSAGAGRVVSSAATKGVSEDEIRFAEVDYPPANVDASQVGLRMLTQSPVPVVARRDVVDDDVRRCCRIRAPEADLRSHRSTTCALDHGLQAVDQAL